MDYAVPILLLALTIAAFFVLGRKGYRDFGISQIVLRVIVALPLLASGILLHFFRVRTVASMIPPAFPAHIFLVVITGVFEIAGAVGLFVPRFRRAAAFWIAVMMVVIIPANVFAAGKVVEGIEMPGLVVRTAIQVVYIVLVLLAGYGWPGGSEPGGSETARSKPVRE
jgi:uncharacterized membrane protein